MTNRDPHNTEFVRKNIEFYDCVARYFTLSSESKLKEDLKRTDTDLVCFYELAELRNHIRSQGGIRFNDFYKFSGLIEENQFKEKFGFNHHKV
jgi:hypothetical protein